MLYHTEKSMQPKPGDQGTKHKIKQRNYLDRGTNGCSNLNTTFIKKWGKIT